MCTNAVVYFSTMGVYMACVYCQVWLYINCVFNNVCVSGMYTHTFVTRNLLLGGVLQPEGHFV